MNSFELNKIAGAGLGTLLLAMWLNVISSAIFSHGKLIKSAYPLPSVQETVAGGSAAPAPSVPPIEQRLAGAHAPATATPLPQQNEQTVAEAPVPSPVSSQARSASIATVEPNHAQSKVHAEAKPAHRAKQVSHKRK